MKGAKEEALEIFGRYYFEIIRSETDMSEEILVSIYANRFAAIAVDRIISAMEVADNLAGIKYWTSVKSELEML